MSALQYPHLVGYGALLTLGSMSAFYLFLKIRQLTRELPDPKLTYTTRQEFSQFREQCHQNCRNFQVDLHEVDEKRSRSLATAHELIRKNSEHIASLIAQVDLTHQRVSELLARTENLMRDKRN